MPRTALRAAVVSAFALLAAGAAGAEPLPGVPSTVPTISLRAALDYARAHQPLVRSALAELAARRSEARIPRSLWMPRVGASAQLLYGSANNSTASYLGVREVDLPRIGGTRTGDVSYRPSPSTLVAATVDQELFDSGRIAALTAVGDALADVARAGSEAARLDVELAVEEAYYAALAAEEVRTATDEAWRRAIAHRDYAQAGVTSGLRPPIELTRARADVAQLEVRRVEAESGVALARAALAASVGSDAPELAAEPLAGGAQPAPAFEEAVRLAATRSPFVQAAIARVRAQRAQTRAIGRELLPNVFLSATLSGRAGGAAPSSGDAPAGGGWVPDVVNWHVGAVLQWSLFDGAVLARRDAARAREGATLADLELARTAALLGVERSYLALVAAERALPGLAAAYEAAGANHAQAEARFRAGLGTSLELADAEALLTRAAVELATGRFSIARARAELGRAVGESAAPPTGSGGPAR